MTEQKIDLHMLSRIDSEQKATASKVDTIETGLHSLEREVSAIQGAIRPPTETPWWIRFIIAPVCVSAVLATAGAVIHLEIRFSSLENNNKSVLQSIGELQRTQVQVILSQAEQHAKAGEEDAAKQQTEQARLLLEKLAAARVSASESFFKSTVSALDQLRSTGLNDDADVHQTGLTLAAYRSVLNPSPPIPTHKSELPNTFPTQLAQLKARAFYDHTTVHLFKDDTVLGAGVAIDASSMAPGQEMFVPPSKFVESNNDDFNDLILIGATQTLDGIAWRRVTFVDTHIRYTGGSLILENVTFVNCTFDFPANNVGQQLVRYAVLEPKQELKVG